MTIDLDVLERLQRDATARPWEAIGVEGVLAIMPDPITGRSDTFLGIATIQDHDGERSARRTKANADLIVAAVNALPDLLAAARERDGLREALVAVISDCELAASACDSEGPRKGFLHIANDAHQALQAGEKG